MNEIGKGSFEHYMLKEIYEQPEAIRKTLAERVKNGWVDFSDLEFDKTFMNTGKVIIAASGTSYHAGMVGRVLIEGLARIPVEIDQASEFRYREVLWNPNDLLIVISQSGETADTLAALRKAQRAGIKILAITNVFGSTIAQEADKVIYTQAGPEVAIASTKAYSTQLLVMYLLALHLASLRKTHNLLDIKGLTNELMVVDSLVEYALNEQQHIREMAKKYHQVQSIFFLGRGLDYAVAMEGALKLKETSYIHAEAYATGELLHGPLALIEPGVPVLSLISQDRLLDKTIANINEIKARGAVLLAICKEDLQEYCYGCDERVLLPRINPLLAPIVSVVPMQIFAYYMALFRGNDVDKPRNLVKSLMED